MEQNLQHHPAASGAMEQLHMPGMVMTSGGMHGFGGGPGVGNLATSNAPGKGLGGALMQSPAQQVHFASKDELTLFIRLVYWQCFKLSRYGLL